MKVGELTVGRTAKVERGSERGRGKESDESCGGGSGAHGVVMKWRICEKYN